MNPFRIALANIQYPATPEESVALSEQAIAQASIERAGLICFPECYIPGYRRMGRPALPPDPAFLERAWSAIASAAAKANLAVVLGTERVAGGALLISALVINRDGTIAGFQDKVQLDPSEEATYSAGSGRRVFQTGPLTFGVAICHEGWRYPETVRWAARRGAHVVFHPHFDEAEPGSYRPSSFADPANSFHEKAVSSSRLRSIVVPRRREHLFFRNRKLCQSRVADHFGGSAARWDAAQLPALRQARVADRGHRHC